MRWDLRRFQDRLSGGSWFFVTLTLDREAPSEEQHVGALRAEWHRLRAKVGRRFGRVADWLSVLDYHKDGHRHLHGAFRSPALARAWADLEVEAVERWPGAPEWQSVGRLLGLVDPCRFFLYLEPFRNPLNAADYFYRRASSAPGEASREGRGPRAVTCCPNPTPPPPGPTVEPARKNRASIRGALVRLRDGAARAARWLYQLPRRAWRWIGG